MTISAKTGPIFVTGNMGYLPSLGAGYSDFDPDAGPSLFFQGTALPDVRIPWPGVNPGGNTGVIQGFATRPTITSMKAVPATNGAATIAAAAHTTNGTALTLTTTAAYGVAINIPIMPWSGSLNGGTAVVAPIVLDYGFAYCNCTSGSATITVNDSTQFALGMPLVIAQVGNSGGTAALLTWVTGQPSATTITVNDAPQATNSSTPVGTGNIWTPREGIQSIYPTAHAPFLGGGAGFFLDDRQGIARGVSVTCNNAAGTGGNVVVSGWDIYGQPMNETLVSAPGTALTIYGLKAFKAIKSVTPAFTDGTYTYSVGTSDLFGFALRVGAWEYSIGSAWAGALITASTGFTKWAAPASGDVRGTFQVSGIGPLGSGVGTTQTNGSVSGTTISGRTIQLVQHLSSYDLLQSSPTNPQWMFGAVQT
jgi:hypothetical protein